MTQEEFNTTKWYKGMHCYYILDVNNSRKLEVVGVDFINGVIVTRENSCTDTPSYHSHFSEIKL